MPFRTNIRDLRIVDSRQKTKKVCAIKSKHINTIFEFIFSIIYMYVTYKYVADTEKYQKIFIIQ